MFKRILLAVDGSAHSLKATEYSIELAKKFDGTVDALYVVDGDTAKKDTLLSTNQFEVEKKRKERLAPVREQLNESKIVFGTHILHGDPGPTIVQFAKEREFDCVVIGSRGLNQLKSILIGSVSQKVAKTVDCPVLIIK